ncbi:gluconate transporter [Candidatus Epulonipiscium fishelsonii]|uniref:Gluconate transporter n=1 Tax=Candidatus Epulonipiscium fishelsonii TaxID=77094 RepID=A0ACC8XBG0_9FIRM|nr:gluconate transporter [Epulopiscium sp. SCG-B05WGA-EpuloA1]ONI40013.1 gluconate transporter [Epulopiscium sp. SCG-B11WGA-EpuloA1]
MSAVMFLIVLAISILMLMLLITRVKLHPVCSLFIVSLFMGLFIGIFEPGFAFLEVIALITAGFGSTLQGMGIPIMLGAILAMGVQDTGAAKSIANYFIKLFNGKNLELAPSLTAYVVSIPVFGDITTILTSNIANVLSKRKRISMGKMAAFTQMGLNLTHAMVPPTPGILAVAILLGADLGLVIGWGIIISIIAFFIVWIILRKWTDHEFIEAIPEIVAEIEETSSNNVEDILIKEDNLPATLASFMTITIPVILIAGSSFINMIISPDSPLRVVTNIFGDKIVALSLGVIYTMWLAYSHKNSVRKSNADSTGNDPENFNEIIFSSWINRGLNVALEALLITGMGGSFAKVIQSVPAISQLSALISDSGVPGLLIPFLVSAIMVAAVGSMTTAGMTAAAVVGPMMLTLGLAPVSTVLAIGAGTLMCNQVNNSGFWVTSKFFNLNFKQGLKYITLPDIAAGLTSFVLIFILATTGII